MLGHEGGRRNHHVVGMHPLLIRILHKARSLLHHLENRHHHHRLLYHHSLLSHTGGKERGVKEGRARRPPNVQHLHLHLRCSPAARRRLLPLLHHPAPQARSPGQVSKKINVHHHIFIGHNHALNFRIFFKAKHFP